MLCPTPLLGIVRQAFLLGPTTAVQTHVYGSHMGAVAVTTIVSILNERVKENAVEKVLEDEIQFNFELFDL